MARKKKPEEHVNHERWLVSYADFITLLFAFFTTMYAISTVDAQKMGQMVMSMRASFDTSFFEAGSRTLTLGSGGGSSSIKGGELVENVHPPGEAEIPPSSANGLKDLRANLAPGPSIGGVKSLTALKREVESLLAPEISKNKVRTRLDRRGLTISIGEVGLFDSGSDELRADGRALLDSIATSIVSFNNHVRIEGHTDDRPIRTSRFPSNWELSTARATSVVSYVVRKFGLPPDRLSAAGYAEYRPVAANDGEDGRARNRRVDIVVMDPQVAAFEPQAGHASALPLENGLR